MELASNDINLQKVAAAFTAQSKIFDEIYCSNTIIQYKRKRVRDHVLQYLQPQSFILELNSGTGEDAVFFAQHDHRVHATDISAGMQEVLQKKVRENNMQNLVSSELCSFTELSHLKKTGPYDVVFSNFAGLNCTDKLDVVLDSFNSLLKPGGIVTLVIMPKLCLWEMLLLFKGKFKTATRRLFSKNGREAHIEGELFKCWYYNPSYIIKYLKNNFDLLSCEGLCTIVPSSYMENFAENHPKIFRALSVAEAKYKSKWPWKNIGDYYIISLKKK
jgi:ubiquinone/menaquinone biosynthesis C-methylase UbiE